MRPVTHLVPVLKANILNLLISCSVYSLVLSICVAHLGFSILTFRIRVRFLPDNLGGSVHLKSLFPDEVVFPGLRVRTWCLLGAITWALQCSAVVNYNFQVINKLELCDFFLTIYLIWSYSFNSFKNFKVNSLRTSHPTCLKLLLDCHLPTPCRN